MGAASRGGIAALAEKDFGRATPSETPGRRPTPRESAGTPATKPQIGVRSYASSNVARLGQRWIARTADSSVASRTKSHLHREPAVVRHDALGHQVSDLIVARTVAQTPAPVEDHCSLGGRHYVTIAEGLVKGKSQTTVGGS